MTEIIHCLCGHNFPVNPNKHKNRNYRLCPKCLMKHEKKFLGHEWQPNKDYWSNRQKAKEESRKRFMERMRNLDLSYVAKFITKRFSWEKD